MSLTEVLDPLNELLVELRGGTGEHAEAMKVSLESAEIHDLHVFLIEERLKEL